jgi:hypothetical protein
VKLIIAKTILAFCVLPLVALAIINPLFAIPFLAVPIGVLITWALDEVFGVFDGYRRK